MANELPSIPTHRFLTFLGSIRPPQSNNFRAGLLSMVNEGAKQITILFASDGGSTDDGIALYTFLKALPIELTMHAVGNVSSSALPVFLAAPNRLASHNAHFFFHNYTWSNGTPETVSDRTLSERSLLLAAALDWTREVIKASTNITDQDFDSLKLFDQPVLIEPSRAAQYGLITRIEEPLIPAGSQPRVVT